MPTYNSRWNKKTFYDNLKSQIKNIKQPKRDVVEVGDVVIGVNEDERYIGLGSVIKNKIGIVIEFATSDIVVVDFGVIIIDKKSGYATHNCNCLKTRTGFLLHKNTVKIVKKAS